MNDLNRGIKTQGASTTVAVNRTRTGEISGGTSFWETRLFLEKPFWDLLEQMAAEAGVSLPKLILHINKAEPRASRHSNQTAELSSRLRVACLRWSEEQARVMPGTARGLEIVEKRPCTFFQPTSFRAATRETLPT